MFKRRCGPEWSCLTKPGAVSGQNSSSASWLSAASEMSPRIEPLPLVTRPMNTQDDHASVIDKEMVKELNQLSIDDRQKVYEDIHGVAEGIQETPELVFRSIQDMFECVQKIRKRSAYEKAIFLSPSYVKNPEFCLQFLRTEDFHARNAAKRMVAYFEMKYELFGLDALVRELSIEEDIDEQVLSLLKRGMCQLLPSMDSAGRQVILEFFKQASDDYTAIQISQMATYFVEKVFKLHHRPEKGVVMVMYDVVEAGAHPSFSLQRVQEATRFFSSYPLNIKAWHVCYKDASSRPTMELFKMAMGTSGRIRVRSCFGTDTECRYHLMSFGIPTHEIPVTNEGTLDLGPHSMFLTRQRDLEAHRVAWRKLHPPPYPTSIDVVFGKGQPFQQHAGNLRMHRVVERYFHLYSGMSRKQSQQLFQQLMTEMKNSGTRFLRKNDSNDAWVEVTDKEAHKKIAAAFRNRLLQVSKNNI